jgi:hypothetical protein
MAAHHMDDLGSFHRATCFVVLAIMVRRAAKAGTKKM